MRRIHLSIALAFFALVSFCPGTAAQEATEQIYTEVDELPQFPGGNEAMYQWLFNNIRYPAAAAENGIDGRVVVKFVVEPDGMITNVEIVNSVDPDIDAEAKRVVRRMPKWIPGKNKGKPVRSYFIMPVTFKLS